MGWDSLRFIHVTLYRVNNFVYIQWALLTLLAKGDKSRKFEMTYERELLISCTCVVVD